MLFPAKDVALVIEKVVAGKDFEGSALRGELLPDQVSEYVTWQLMSLECQALQLEIRAEKDPCKASVLAGELRRRQFVVDHRLFAFLNTCMAIYGCHHLYSLGYTAVDIGLGFKVYQYKPEEE